MKLSSSAKKVITTVVAINLQKHVHILDTELTNESIHSITQLKLLLPQQNSIPSQNAINYINCLAFVLYEEMWHSGGVAKRHIHIPLSVP